MIYPNFIKKDDVIGIVAPSAGASNEIKIKRFLNAKKNLEDIGYKLKLSDNLFKCEKGRSSDKLIRAKEVNDFFSNNDVNLIMCATGGDFLVEILPYIDFNIISNNPKYITGFSDPTGILYPITTKYDIATIYGTNFSSLGSSLLHRSELEFLELIKGNLIKQKSYDKYEDEYFDRVTGLEGYNLTKNVYWKTLDNSNIKLSGRIIGGCLDIISTIMGTKYDGTLEFIEKYKDDGIIFYFDNCELSMEEVIRVLWKMKEYGYFKYCNGVIFGRFGVNITSYDYDVKSCLEDSILSDLNIPVVYDTDFSHKGPCINVINGSIANVEIVNSKGIISFELK